MSSDRRGIRYIWIGLMVVLLSCLSTSQSTTKSTQKSNGVVPSAEGNSASEDDFPRTPDPITVHATLDPAQAADNSEFETPGMIFNWPVDGETTDGMKFNLMPEGGLLSQDADGGLQPAFGTVVTVTPVSAIADLPFSQGYLAAVHIGPDGLLMISPGSLSLAFPGDYDGTQWIGFAADGNGEDFHLFPITVDSYEGTTTAYFSVSHFSLYGVALATLQEIEAQTAHPPANPVSQDDDELAPLLPLVDPFSEELTPLQSKVQLQLNKSYNRMIKRDMDRLADIPCNRVDVTAYYFNAWLGKVEAAGQTSHFQQQINRDAAALLDRLTECVKVTCDTCLKNAPGNKLDKASVNTLLVLAAFAGDMARILDRMDEVGYWLRLSGHCADEAGLPPIAPSAIGDCEGAQCQTSEPLVCKE
jgi:hypothetical protein